MDTLGNVHILALNLNISDCVVISPLLSINSTVLDNTLVNSITVEVTVSKTSETSDNVPNITFKASFMFSILAVGILIKRKRKAN